MNCGRNLKYSGEELAVAISQLLGALSDSKYYSHIKGLWEAVIFSSDNRFFSFCNSFGYQFILDSRQTPDDNISKALISNV